MNDETIDRIVIFGCDLRDHPGKVVVGSIFLTAAISWGFLALSSRPVPDFVIVLLVVNAALSSCGSAFGGLLIRDTLAQRILTAFAAGAFGFVGYCALVVCPNMLGPATH